MASRDYTHVRIERSTYEALRGVRASMELGDAVGLREFRRDQLDRVSLDQVIQALIAFREKHRERRKRSAANRKRKKRTEEADTQLAEEHEDVSSETIRTEGSAATTDSQGPA